jgi:hypothetical protein
MEEYRFSKEQLSRRKRRLMDERNFVGCVGFHSSTQPTDLSFHEAVRTLMLLPNTKATKNSIEY